MLVDWNIQHRSQVCQICSNNFKDKESYHTALFEEPDQYERWDVCEACWKNRRTEISASAESMISHWKGIFEAPTPPAPEPIQKENAESLLRKLIELEDPKYLNVQFILAVMLERKRILKIKVETKKGGTRWLMYERAKTGELFPVQDPDLRLDALDSVQEQIADLFERGLSISNETPVAETGPEAPHAEPSEGDTDEKPEPARQPESDSQDSATEAPIEPELPEETATEAPIEPELSEETAPESPSTPNFN